MYISYVYSLSAFKILIAFWGVGEEEGEGEGLRILTFLMWFSLLWSQMSTTFR